MKNLEIALKNLNIFPSQPTYNNAPNGWGGMLTDRQDTLLYVLEGSFVLHIDGLRYIVRKHQLVLLPQGHTYTYWKLPHQTLVYLEFAFRAECHGEDFFSFFGLADQNHVIDFPKDEIMRCYALMQDFSPENIPQRIINCSQLAWLCASYTLKRIHTENTVNEFADVIRFMRQHIAEDLSLSALAASLHFNPSYFSQKFKEKVGVSPIRFFAQMRAEQAAKLLMETTLSVPDVATALGFTNIYYFRTFFQKHIGVRPDEYRGVFRQPTDLCLVKKDRLHPPQDASKPQTEG